MDKRKLTAAAALAFVMMTAFAASCIWEEADSETHDGDLLFDSGNGSTEWFDTVPGSTVGDMISATLSTNGHECSVSGNVLTVDGKTSVTIGSSKTSEDVLSYPGTSGITVTSSWTVYSWNGEEWRTADDLSASPSGIYAAGFYPSGTVPAETPDDIAVTCFGTDSLMSFSEEADLSEDSPSLTWAMKGLDGNCGTYAQILTAGGFVFAKFGTGSGTTKNTACIVCADTETGDVKWYFRYAVTYYETSTEAIVGDYIYVQTSFGKIYKIPWKTAEGDMSASDTVTTFYGEPIGSGKAIPLTVPDFVSGSSYADGFTSISYDSGVLITKASTGMIYCFDLDLNPIWSCQTFGTGYTYAPTIDSDFVYAGQFDGHLYVIDKKNGDILLDQTVFEAVKYGKSTGSVCPVSVVYSGDSEFLCFVFNDGLGMGSGTYGLAVYEVVKGDATADVSLMEVYKQDSQFGSVNAYLVPYVSDDFAGVYFFCTKDSVPYIGRMDVSGNTELLYQTPSTVHSPAIMVNGEYIAASGYGKGQPLFMTDLSGKEIGGYNVEEQYTEYSMTDVLMIGGYFIGGNDGSLYCVSGGFVQSGGSGSGTAVLAAEIAIVIAVLLIAAYLVMRFALGWQRPLKHIKESYRTFMHGEKYSHNTQRRHKLWLTLTFGIILTLTVCLISLCVGPTSVMSPTEMFSNLFSAIGKGGNNLTYDEIMIYSARLPRTLVALAVGIGLSVAGAMYQAVIRNPLVDPYIMGVSSGAGTAAIAVIAFDFTFFGLFPSHSIFLTAIAAALGGLLAYGCTMVLANKAGGSSINYVLAGVIVGLVFGAAQTLMLTFAGEQVSGALSWLYGSFAEITWTKVWIVLIPALAMSFASLLWAKEFNLILLGEDQARQMGLNVKRFNLMMLTMASILTAICVAFCGIIGFVGLVIPHLCRMMLGGDHRLVLPASMAFGGFLMITADILARMVVPGLELPVGAITTIIGVPVFAWLLIKRGKMYDG